MLKRTRSLVDVAGNNDTEQDTNDSLR